MFGIKLRNICIKIVYGTQVDKKIGSARDKLCKIQKYCNKL